MTVAREAPGAEHLALWERVFGDPADFIVRYYAEVNALTLAVREGETLAGMANLSPAEYGGRELRGLYVYAVCTAPEYRGRGIFAALMKSAEAVRDVKSGRSPDFLYLIPADGGLRAAYRRMGYTAPVVSREFALDPGVKLTPFDGDCERLYGIYVRSLPPGRLRRPFPLFRLAVGSMAGGGAETAYTEGGGYLIYNKKDEKILEYYCPHGTEYGIIAQRERGMVKPLSGGLPPVLADDASWMDI